MNIGLVIGVSDYSDAKNNLPGCKNDAEAIYQILKRTDKFESILYINSNETSAKTKELIVNFIVEKKGQVLNEFFLYYSGHGEFVDNEFYYVLSDFDEKKKNQTSLQNREIDDLIRTLSPAVVIKVIDACQSGTTYIKESNVLNKYFNDTKNGFSKCYFLNSSLNNQSSFQDKNLSFFTFSFIKALREHGSNEIRYKDIIDAISDEFANNNEQTPFFVIQAELTEKFCSFSKDLREYLNLFNATVLTQNEIKIKPLSIAEIIKLDARDYLNEEEAIKSLEFIRNEFNSIKLDHELGQLYNLEINFLEEYSTIPQTKVIGDWLKKNKNDFFARVVYEEQYDDESGHEYIAMTGFDLKFDAPFKAISIEIDNRFPNLISYQCNIVFLISKKMIRFFYFIANYIDESWTKKNLNINGIQWTTNELKIADHGEIENAIIKVKNTIEAKIKKDIQDRFAIEHTIEVEESSSDDVPI